MSKEPLSPLGTRSGAAAGLMLIMLASEVLGFDLLGFLNGIDLGIPLTLLEKAEIIIAGLAGLVAWLQRWGSERPLSIWGSLR